MALTKTSPVSPVQQYEELLATKVGTELTEDRLFLVFRVFDQLIPGLGVYSHVMKNIRNEIFEACYSKQYTGNKHEQEKTYVERVPYFVLTQRYTKDRDESTDELKAQMESLKSSLFHKQVEFESSMEKANDLAKDKDQLEITIESLKNDVANRDDKLRQLEEAANEQADERENMEQQLKDDILDMQEQMKELKEELIYLQQYKEGYTKLQGAFYKKDVMDSIISRKKRVPMPATQHAHLSSDIEEAVKLEEQVLTVQNALIEEFDAFLEEHKLELGNEFLEASFSTGSHSNWGELGTADIKLEREEIKFNKAMEETRVELELLTQHRSFLQEQVYQLEQQKPAQQTKKRYNMLDAANSRQDTFDSLGGSEQDDGEGQMNDPFIPQERVFCRYAAMLYTSDNHGKNFNEFKDARYCPSCGEKTVLCPHKVLSQEHIFPLPSGSTHLKISRPKVRINPDMMSQAPGVLSDAALDTASFTPDSKVSGFAKGLIASRVSTGHSPIVGSDAGEVESSIHSAENSAANRAASTEVHFIYPLQRIWEDFRRRSVNERNMPRPLSKERVKSLIEQFAASVLWIDENGDELDEPGSFLDLVYTFFESRYLRKDAALLSSYDFLASVIDFSASDRFLLLFAHILAGNYDGTVFRYILLMCNVIDIVDWQNVDDFRTFASVVYPSLSDEDVETLHMGYQSFSENKISKSKVADYIVYILLKYREPRFLEMEMKFQNRTGQDVQHITENEFLDIVDEVISIPNDTFCRRLFQQSLAAKQLMDSKQPDMMLPIIRLAQITSYLELMEMQTGIEEDLFVKMQHPGEPEEIEQEPQEHEEPILTWSAAKHLATTIFRRRRIRQARHEEEYYDDD